MKMEHTECSETLAYKIQTPGNYPEQSTQHFWCVRLLRNICRLTRPVHTHVITVRLWGRRYEDSVFSHNRESQWSTACLWCLCPCSSLQEVNFVTWQVYKVSVAETEPVLYLLGAEYRFQVIGWGNSQNTSDWSAWEATLICKMSLHDVKVGVWCATSATNIWGCFYRFVYKYSDIFLAHTKTAWREAFRMECLLYVWMCGCVWVCYAWCVSANRGQTFPSNLKYCV
jgi:hypothetical protein